MLRGALVLAGCFFFPAIRLKGQQEYGEFYQLCRTARIYKVNDKPDSALALYTLAFSRVNFVPEFHLRNAIEASHKHKEKNVSRALKQRLNIQQKTINKEYKKQIDSLFREDQRVRSTKYMKAQKEYHSCLKSGTCDDSRMNKLKGMMRKWNKTDSLNMGALLGLIREKGFPGEKAVGSISAEKAYIILLHFDSDTSNVVLKPILDQALAEGNISPMNYATIEDRRRVTAGKAPYYYAIPFGIEKLPAEEVDKVNQRRQQIFLGKVSESQIIKKTKKYYRVITLE